MMQGLALVVGYIHRAVPPFVKVTPVGAIQQEPLAANENA
jgi:hypothetical protein